jgi:hypothetical protein
MNKQIIISIFILISTEILFNSCTCKSLKFLGYEIYDCIPNKFNDSIKFCKEKSLNNFNNNNDIFKIINVNKIKEYQKNDYFNFYKYNNIFYLFLDNLYLLKYSNYYSKKPNDNFPYEYKFLIFDSLSTKIVLYDSINVSSHEYRLFSTSNYLYFVLNIRGYQYIFEKPYENLVTGIIIINKNNPLEIRKYEYENKKIILVEQKDKYLRIVVAELEAKFTFFGWLSHKISNHFQIGDFVSTGKYKEYMYNENLNLISIKEINKDKIGY